MVTGHTESYNDRLFNQNRLRRSVHLARFNWLEKQLAEKDAGAYDMVEIGCFDGRILHHCPAPRQYAGFDANWEGGLDEAKAQFAEHHSWTFEESSHPSDLDGFEDGAFDVGVSLETMEHVDPDLVEDYVRQLARIVRGTLYVTVPNEKGAVFAAKRTLKRLMGHKVQEYSTREFFDTVIGRTGNVPRDGHKGFDYDWLAGLIAKYFDIARIESVPSGTAPVWASVTVGIVANARKN